MRPRRRPPRGSLRGARLTSSAVAAIRSSSRASTSPRTEASNSLSDLLNSARAEERTSSANDDVAPATATSMDAATEASISPNRAATSERSSVPSALTVAFAVSRLAARASSRTRPRSKSPPPASPRMSSIAPVRSSSVTSVVSSSSSLRSNAEASSNSPDGWVRRSRSNSTSPSRLTRPATSRGSPSMSSRLPTSTARATSVSRVRSVPRRSAMSPRSSAAPNTLRLSVVRVASRMRSFVATSSICARDVARSACTLSSRCRDRSDVAADLAKAGLDGRVLHTTAGDELANSGVEPADADLIGVIMRRDRVGVVRGERGTPHFDQRADEHVPVVGFDQLAALVWSTAAQVARAVRRAV